MANPDELKLFENDSLHNLASHVTPNEKLNDDVVEILKDIGTEFMHQVLNTACKLAKHRSSDLPADDKDLDRLTVKDLNAAVMMLYGSHIDPNETLTDITRS